MLVNNSTVVKNVTVQMWPKVNSDQGKQSTLLQQAATAPPILNPPKKTSRQTSASSHSHTCGYVRWQRQTVAV